MTRGSQVAGQAPAVQDHAALQRSVTRLVGGRFGQHADLRLHSTVARLLLPLRLARCLAPHSLQLHLRVANSLRRLHTHLRLGSSVARLNLQQWHGRFLPRTLRTDLRLELSRWVGWWWAWHLLRGPPLGSSTVSTDRLLIAVAAQVRRPSLQRHRKPRPSAVSLHGYLRVSTATAPEILITAIVSFFTWISLTLSEAFQFGLIHSSSHSLMWQLYKLNLYLLDKTYMIINQWRVLTCEI